MLILQNGIATRAGLIVKALGRAFRSQPKKKLELYAATDEGKANSTWLCLVNTNSVYPYFNGKGFKEEWKTSALFKELAGKEDVKVHVPVDYNLKTDAVPTAPSLDDKDTGATSKATGIDYSAGEAPLDVEMFKTASGEKKYLKVLKDVSKMAFQQHMPDLTVYQYHYEYTDDDGNVVLFGNYTSPDGAVGKGWYFVVTSKDFVANISKSAYDMLVASYTGKTQTDNHVETPKAKTVEFDEKFRYSKVLFGTSTSDGDIIPKGSYIRFRIASATEIQPTGTTFLMKGKYKTPTSEDASPLVDIILPVSGYEDCLVPITDDEYIAGPSVIEAENEVVKKDVMFKMLKNSGSSALSKGGTAKLIASYDKMDADIVKTYDLPSFATDYTMPVHIVQVLTMTDKYVVLIQSQEGEYYTRYETDPVTVPSVSTESLAGPSANVASKEVSNLFDSGFDAYTASVGLSPVINITPDIEINIKEYDFATLGQKLNSLSAVFDGGKISSSLVQEFNSRIRSKSGQLADKIEKEIVKTGLYMKPGSKGVGSVKAYSGTAYGSINRFLRNPDTKYDYSAEKKHVKGIDDAFRLYGIRFPKDMPVYRGASISNEDIEQLQQGGKHLMHSYSSASLQTSTAMSFYRANTSDSTVALAQGNAGKVVDYEYAESNQGNKIFFTIKRLDRCLSLYIAEISQHSAEMELLINRGTELVCKHGTKPLHIHTSTKGVRCWATQAEVAKPDGLTESVSFRYLLEQQSPKLKEMFDDLDKLALIQYKLDLVVDDLETEEANSL